MKMAPRPHSSTAAWAKAPSGVELRSMNSSCRARLSLKCSITIRFVTPCSRGKLMPGFASEYTLPVLAVWSNLAEKHSAERGLLQEFIGPVFSEAAPDERPDPVLANLATRPRGDLTIADWRDRP